MGKICKNYILDLMMVLSMGFFWSRQVHGMIYQLFRVGYHPLESPIFGGEDVEGPFSPNQEIHANLLYPPKFNSEFTPEKMVVGRRSFPIGKVTSQGRNC